MKHAQVDPKTTNFDLFSWVKYLNWIPKPNRNEELIILNKELTKYHTD